MPEKKNENKEIESGWIRELAAILHETGLTEIEVEKANTRLRVSRAATAAPAIAAPTPAPTPTTTTEAPPQSAPHASPVGAVPSPMVGTAYLSPSPGADPFVSKGDNVSEGQTLMIIEAMKTMNPIAAPRAGVVKDILVSDSQPVEFGEPLAIIE